MFDYRRVYENMAEKSGTMTSRLNTSDLKSFTFPTAPCPPAPLALPVRKAVPGLLLSQCGPIYSKYSKTGLLFFVYRWCGLLFLGVDLVAIWVITHSSRVCLSTLRHFHFSRGSD